MKKFTLFLSAMLIVSFANAQTPPTFGSMMGIGSQLYVQGDYGTPRSATLNWKIVSAGSTTCTWFQTVGSSVTNTAYAMQLRYKNASCGGAIENQVPSADKLTTGNSSQAWWSGTSPTSSYPKITYFADLSGGVGFSETQCWSYDPNTVTVFNSADATAPIFNTAPQIAIGTSTLTITLDAADDSGHCFFLIKDKNGVVTPYIKDVITLPFNVADKYQDYYIWAADFSGNISAMQTLRTYNPAIPILSTPTNIDVDEWNYLTFNAVPNAVSYNVYVYVGTALMNTITGVTDEGYSLTALAAGNYVLYIEAVGDGINYQNSPFSAPYNFTRDGDLASEYCYKLMTGSGTGNNFVLTWETLANGALQLKMIGVNNNEPRFRAFNFSNMRINGANTASTYFNAAVGENGSAISSSNRSAVATCTLKAGQTLPKGTIITWTGNWEYETVNNNNLYFVPNPAYSYTYGANCSYLTITQLPAPENVAVNASNLITFDPVANAATYLVNVCIGEIVVYTQTLSTNSATLAFNIPGTFNVKVKAIPSTANLIYYSESDFSTYVWVIPHTMPTTIPTSVYCGYQIGSAAIAQVLISWETNAAGHIVITMEPKTPATQLATSFRANGMGATADRFKINGVTATNLLEKIEGNGLFTQQTFRAKNGFVLQPGMQITFNGMIEYRTNTANPPGGNNESPTINFSTPYIYGSNCNGPVTVLPAPVNLDITNSVLTFDPVTNALSYKVYIYDSSNSLVYTIDNFVSGSVINYFGGTYTVKVQAIGDGVTYLSSELSAGVTFVVAPCNLLSTHPLMLGNSSITYINLTPDATYGTEKSTAPYYAPGNNPSTNYTATATATGATITLGTATTAQWQAQFRLLPTTPIYLKAGGTYDIQMKVTTNKSTPFYCKLFDQNDNISIEMAPRQNVTGEKVFTLFNVPVPFGLDRIFQLLFDFGGNPVNAEIVISDIIICGPEMIKLATPTNLSISTDNKLSFDPVTNASSYTVFVYNSSNTVVHTITNFVSGNVINYNVVGSYTVKVQAIGDGIDYVSSDLSDPINWHIFKVLDPPTNITVNAQNELNFDAVNNASSYTVYIYNSSGGLAHTITNFVPGSVINYTVVGHYTIKVQTIGDEIDYISSELSAPINWSFTKILATPTNLAIDFVHNLTFDAVQNISSYTVFVYQNAGDATALVTLPNFTIGSVVNMGALPYGKYYVRAKAIGDNDLYFDSELSAAYMWYYLELIPCNIVYNHPFTAGEVFFAPNWTESNNYTFSASGVSANIHLGEATTEQWQSQFRIVFKTPIDFDASTRYEVKFKVKTVGEVNMYAKMYESNDNIFVELLQRAAINAPTGVEKTVRFTPNTNSTGNITTVSQVLLDFGGNAANLDIEITSFSICEAEMIKLNTPVNLYVSGNILTFDAVEHASSYTVYIYDASDGLAKTITNFVSGSAITNLPNGNYKIKVQAIGDHIDYLDSELSAAYTYVHTGFGDVTENTVSIFPNPVANTLNISGTTAKEAYIIDVLGKKQSVSIIDNTINVSALTKGIYILIVDNQRVRFIKK